MTNRNVIKQSYELNNARYKLNAVEMDIILKMIAEIKHEDEDFKSYKFHRTELEKRLGKTLNKEYLKETAKNLLSKPFLIEEKRGFVAFNWVSHFRYYSDTSEIEVSFHPDLKPYLMHLKSNFVLTDLRELLKLTSEYSKRLYMLFKQWLAMEQDKVIEVSELQEMFQVPKSLLRYADFKSKIIEPSLKQINVKTDLKVSYEPIKSGRKVTHLKFTVNKQIGQQLTFDDSLIMDVEPKVKPSFKDRLISYSPFYFHNEYYKVNVDGLLIDKRGRIIKTKIAKKLYLEFEKHEKEIVPVHNVNIFDVYENM